MNNVDQTLVDKILRYIPDNLNPVDYLMEELNISRDSVYRRINGKKSFTFHEVVNLSVKLNFSLDEITYLMRNGLFGNLSESNVEESIYFMFNHFTSLVKNYHHAQNTEILITANRVVMILSCEQKELFRFIYYRCMHIMRGLPIDFAFSDLTIPHKTIMIHDEFCAQMKSLKNVSFIFDSNLFLNVVKDIQYYYQRKLISENEMKSLKNDLFTAIDRAKEEMLNRHLRSSPQCDFYLSSLVLDSNTLYIKYDDVQETNIWSFSSSPICITNSAICKIHREWVNSLKRYSALISGTNENIMYEFLSKQYEYVNNMDKEFYS